MINIFETSFEARERRFQIEKLYHGETVDLVGVVTTNGVPQNITGYAVSGVFQPTSMNGSPDFYELSADIVDNKVIVHWEKGKDFGENSYMVWALLTDGDNASYPIVWRLDMAYSPNFPLSSLAPIPKAIDFSKYDLLNAPWLELSAFDEFVDGLSNEYLPLSGGVVSGDFEVKDFLKGANRSLVIGKNNVQQYSDRGVALGTNLSTNVAAVAIGDNTRAGNSSIAIGQSSEAGDGSGIVIGNNSKTYSNSIAIGAHTSANYSQSIAIGNEASTTKTYEVRLGGPYQSQFGQPSLYVHDIPILSGSDHRIPKDRLPYLSEYAKKEEIPEVPTDLSAFTNSPGYLTAHQSLEDYYTKTQTDEKLTAYAQLSDLDNIDVGEMSACLSSDEFDEVNFLTYNSEGDVDVSAVSILDIGNKINNLIALLKRVDDPHSGILKRKTYVKYTNNTETYLDINGTLASNSIPNINSVSAIIIGTDVTSMANQLFSNKTNLQEVTIPGTVGTVSNRAFGYGYPTYVDRAVSSVTLNEGTTILDTDCFYGTTFSSITIPSTVTTMVGNTFGYNYHLLSFYVPATLTSMPMNDGGGFSGCKNLSSIIVDSENPNYKSVDEMLLTKDGTTLLKIPQAKNGSITVPEGVTSINGGGASGLTNCTSLTLPSTLISIGDSALDAFDGQPGWASITIPSSVTSIGQYGLSRVTGKTIVMEGKTMAQVQAMSRYPWDVKSGSGTKFVCTDGTITR